MQIMVGLGFQCAALLLYSIAWQLGWIAGQRVPGSCSVMGKPLLCFSSVAQPCEPDLIAKIIIRREWQRGNLITVNPQLLVPPNGQ
jgi:hypothetical protein